jgi:hypothetical protein
MRTHNQKYKAKERRSKHNLKKKMKANNQQKIRKKPYANNTHGYKIRRPKTRKLSFVINWLVMEVH